MRSPRPWSALSRPKGTLEPGMDSGRRNGTVKSMQAMSSPRSPNWVNNSPSVIPSLGRVLAISESTEEARCSAWVRLGAKPRLSWESGVRLITSPNDVRDREIPWSYSRIASSSGSASPSPTDDARGVMSTVSMRRASVSNTAQRQLADSNSFAGEAGTLAHDLKPLAAAANAGADYGEVRRNTNSHPGVTAVPR
jgi:hypothetical protein